MPLVIFDPISKSGTPCVVDVPKGGRLVDVIDRSDAIVPFSCRSASCGTCRIDVFEGVDLLEPPRDDELDVLDVFGDDPTRRRLACQARLRPGDGRVRVRPVDV
jgi:ferredoxin